MKFICDMNIIQIYLMEWGEKWNSATPLSKFCEKVGKMRLEKEKKKSELWQE